MYRVFVGFDKAEVAAYQVCCHSINVNASKPVAIIPLNIDHFPWFTNAHPKSSTDFAFTRFLVPYLSNFDGMSVFMDCDMLVRSDITKLFDEADHGKAVSCVKHDYTPSTQRKFLNQPQTEYEYKNWSSVMIFNNRMCEKLTPEYVNEASGLELHRFEWLADKLGVVHPERDIGTLPKSWNHLVGEQEGDDPDIVHFTLGGPYFNATKGCDFRVEWWNYWRESNSVLDTKLLGEG